MNKQNKIYYIAYIITVVLIIQSCGSYHSSVRSTPYTSSFNDGEITLIMEADTSRVMRIFQTDSRNDSIILRAQSNNVTPDLNDPFLNTLIKRMYTTVTDSASLGVGIAAPQVGVSKNVILVERLDKSEKLFEVYLNPKILQWSQKRQNCNEGCLSVPNVRGTTKTRAYAILVEYYTLAGKKQIEMIEGYTAVIFQHEIDHLNGVLFIDHLE